MADDTPPKWENIPPEFKLDVVGRLDVNARGSFLQSSDSNKCHGELVPYDFKFLKITPQTFVSGQSLTFLFETNESTKTVGQAEVVLGILSIFKHRRSKVETLEIGLLHEDVMNKSLYRLTKDLLKTVAGQILVGSQVSLKVKNFIWHGPVKDIRFPELLSHFNKDHLISMYLSIKGDIPVDVMDGIMDTEQWHQLKSLRVTARIHDDLSIFNHLEKVEVDVHGMNPAMFADFVKKFHSKNLPHESYFAFHCPFQLDQEFEMYAFDLVNADLPNPIMVAVSDRLGQDYGKLDMTDTTNKLLVLMKGSKLAAGMVCEENDCELEMCHQVIQIRFRSFGIVS